MRVSRWGNSLGVRLPRTLVEEMSLKEGDEVNLSAAGIGKIEVARDGRREAALDRLRAMSWPLPKDYRFDRNEIYAARADRIGLTRDDE